MPIEKIKKSKEETLPVGEKKKPQQKQSATAHKARRKYYRDANLRLRNKTRRAKSKIKELKRKVLRHTKHSLPIEGLHREIERQIVISKM